MYECGEEGSNLLCKALNEYIDDYNQSKGGFNDSRTVYRHHFSSENVFLQDGSIIEHTHWFKDMIAGGTFEEMISEMVF